MASEAQRQLASLLVEPQETLGVEFKSWLRLAADNEHKAILAKAVIAMANHGGGVVVCGFRAAGADSLLVPEDTRPENLADFTPDCVNAITSSYIEPPIHCDVHLVAEPATGAVYPVIVVPPGKTPVRSKKGGPNGRVMDAGQYFVRRPGPKSEVPQSGQEWDALIARCVVAQRENLLDQVRAILLGGSLPVEQSKDSKTELDEWAAEGIARWKSLLVPGTPQVAKLEHGYFCVSYILKGSFIPMTLAPFRDALHHNTIRHTGWPLFVTLTREGVSPYPYNGLVEAWVGRESKLDRPANADFWRASPDGRFFLIRGHAEDGLEQGAAPGAVFDITIPAWRVGEALLHAANMAAVLGDPGATVLMRVEWTGLNGRRLAHVEGRRLLFDDHTTHQDAYVGYAEVQASSVGDALPEIVDRLVRPMYEMFNFFQIPATLTAEEMKRMRANRF